MRRLSHILLLPLTLACADSSHAPQLDKLGDPCRTAYDECTDDHTVLSCVDNVLVERDCDSVCSERGPSYVADGCDLECVCVLADPTGCTPGETGCADAETMTTCDDNQVPQPSACTDVCATAGLVSLGCMESDVHPLQCWCTAEGTPCDATVPVCADEQTLASCEDGIWTFMDCTQTCGAAATCDPLLSPPACACA